MQKSLETAGLVMFFLFFVFLNDKSKAKTTIQLLLITN